MTESKLSIFSIVSQECDPKYVPESPSKAMTSTSNNREKSSSCHDGRKSYETGGKIHNHLQNQGASNVKSASVVSGKASKKSRKSDAQRYEELSEKWDQAKQEVRLQDHAMLQAKVVLQQELIRKQEEYSEKRRETEAEIEAQKREAQRVKKHAKQEELQQICKKSLEEDKKAQIFEKPRTKGLKDEMSSAASSLQSVPSSPTKSPIKPNTPGGRSSNPFKMTLAAVAPTPDLAESDTDENEQQKQEAELPKEVPWHEQQLYRLYGRHADYFIHPKMEVKTQVKAANPKLQQQGGRAGADALWQTLRHDSNVKLLKEDAHIPQGLKEAYGAFARQSLRKSHVPVRRMFCTEDDLPEMTRLLDNSKVQQVRKMRHKTDLMYRASLSNQDRTYVLTFNNPLPEFHEGTMTVNQYIPSWQDNESEHSNPDYLKWLSLKDSVTQENENQGDGRENGNNKLQQVTQSIDDDLILIMSRKPPIKQKQKYVFLSEKDTTVKGMFSEKYKGDRDNKDVPRPYKGDAPRSYSALGGMIPVTPADAIQSDSTRLYSAPLPSHNDIMKQYTSNWQPLNMNALVEYKKHLKILGEGDFNLGRTRMWSQTSLV